MSQILRWVKPVTRPAVALILLAIIMVGVSSWGWWHYVYSSPTQTFDRMLSTMLSTTSVTRHTSQGDEASGQSLDQRTLLATSPINSISGLNDLVQGNTTITTENIGTPQYDYVRYKSITTDQKTSTGQAIDFSSVLNVWGKSDASTVAAPTAQLYTQHIFGVIPVANLNAAQRTELLNQIRNDQVYTVDYGATEVEQRGSRPTYTYPVTVNPVAYVKMLKTFAAQQNLHQLDQIDPAQYQSAAPLKFQLVVDTWSGQLLEIRYNDATRSELYGSYGIRSQIEEPTTTIPITELQTRLQNLN